MTAMTTVMITIHQKENDLHEQVDLWKNMKEERESIHLQKRQFSWYTVLIMMILIATESSICSVVMAM